MLVEQIRYFITDFLHFYSSGKALWNTVLKRVIERKVNNMLLCLLSATSVAVWVCDEGDIVSSDLKQHIKCATCDTVKAFFLKH